MPYFQMERVFSSIVTNEAEDRESLFSTIICETAMLLTVSGETRRQQHARNATSRDAQYILKVASTLPPESRRSQLARSQDSLIELFVLSQKVQENEEREKVNARTRLGKRCYGHLLSLYTVSQKQE